MNDTLKVYIQFMSHKLILRSESRKNCFEHLSVLCYNQSIFCNFFALVGRKNVKAFWWCLICKEICKTLEAMTKRNASILISSPLRVYGQISWPSLSTIYRGLLDPINISIQTKWHKLLCYPDQQVGHNVVSKC